MAPPGLRIKKLAPKFERDTRTRLNDSAGTLRGREAEAHITQCPLLESPTSLPEVPRRPTRYRTPPQQQKQTLPSSTQDASHQRQGERSSTPTPRRQLKGPPTPENSTLSTNFYSINESTASLQDVQAKLSNLEIEVQSLESKLEDRVQAQESLRNSLEEAIQKYDDAISDLRKSRREKDQLQNEVDRLRKELKQERAERRELEDGIASGIRREKELREMLKRLTKLEETVHAGGRRNIEAQEVNNVTLSMERRRSQVVYERYESRVSWSRNFSSQDKKKAGRGAKGKSYFANLKRGTLSVHAEYKILRYLID
jgi:myosin heavy subunit